MKRNIKTMIVMVLVVMSVLLSAACSGDPATITDVSWKSEPANTEYELGSELDYSGGKLTVKYSDDTNAEVEITSDMYKSGYDKDKLGKQNVTLEYQGKTVTFDIIVYSKIVAINNAEKFQQAVAQQEDNQLWVVQEGKYDMGRLKDIDVPYNSSEFYFPIFKDGITIRGNGNAVIYSSVVKDYGNYDGQNFITVWGNNTTIKDLSIMGKVGTGKVIEIIDAQNFTLQNVKLLPNTEVDKASRDASNNIEGASGPILFSSGNERDNNADFGNVIIENVEIHGGYIAFIPEHMPKDTQAKGKFNIINTTIHYIMQLGTLPPGNPSGRKFDIISESKTTGSERSLVELNIKGLKVYASAEYVPETEYQARIIDVLPEGTYEFYKDGVKQ